MAAIDDVPSTDLLLRPILEALRGNDEGLTVVDIVDALYDSISLPPADVAEANEALWERVGGAIETLVYAHAVKGGQLSQGRMRGSRAKGRLARIKATLHIGKTIDPTWIITNHGRGISDHELAAAFTQQCAELSAPGYTYSWPAYWSS